MAVTEACLVRGGAGVDVGLAEAEHTVRELSELACRGEDRDSAALSALEAQEA